MGEHPTIHGGVAAGFSPVADAFRRNFTRLAKSAPLSRSTTGIVRWWICGQVTVIARASCHGSATPSCRRSA
ncbi:hypothetical protein [Nocardia cyriacigeorgica]|uniref:hypothetical protein n=1 Tax=Nocardia cyriacigeorgica TaxID=135487 RepID=UPI002456C521|nr:hypothetical protein [Nocardia cyriacigeorgica]